MYKLIRFYNQNRKKIFKTILIIVFIIGIIQVLNYLVAGKRNDRNNLIDNNSGISSTNSKKELVSNKSAVSGENISNDKLECDIDVIKKFMQYCNDRDLENAYKLLTNECKEEMFSTIDDFKNIYYIPIFKGENKIYTLENWIGDIYKIEINDDILATGKYEKQNTIIDYITVKKNEDGKYNLSINNYLGKTQLDKEMEQDGVKIRAIETDMYMDYTTYTFEIINNSNRIVLLDDLSNIDTIYIEDDNKIKYSAYTHELSQQGLKIGVLEKKQVKVKYYSKYGSTKEMSKAVFSKVILDYEKFEKLSNNSVFDNYSIFEIEL